MILCASFLLFKKRILQTSIPFIFLVILYGGFLSSCNTIMPVQVTGINNFKSVNTLNDPELKFDLVIENPNSFGVSITQMNLDLYNVDTKLVAIRMIEKTKVSRKQSVIVQVIMKPSVESIQALIKSEMSNLVRGKVNQNLEIRGELVIRKFIFTKRIKLKEAVRL